MRGTTVKTPAGLRIEGKELWTVVLSEYQLETHQELPLLRACRCVDRLESIDKALRSSHRQLPTVVQTRTRTRS